MWSSWRMRWWSWMWFKQGQIEVECGDENEFGSGECGNKYINPHPNQSNPSLYPHPNQSKPIV